MTTYSQNRLDRWWRAVGALAALLCTLLVAGCLGGDSDSSSSDSGSPASGTGGTLVIGMTASDIPGLDAGTYENQGWEGERFVGFQLYDGLTRMTLDTPGTPKIAPALAQSYKSSPDAKTWTFKLRPGVTFQDGTPWNADAAIFGLDRLTKPKSAAYNEDAAGSLGLYTGTIASYRKLDDMSIEITLKEPYALFPQDLPFLPFPSPTAVKKLGDDFAKNPVGTGPFKFESEKPGTSLTLVRNPDYWRGAPKLDRVIMRPMPDANARVNALISGEVNWIEFPTPNNVELLRGKGFEVHENPYSHIWAWVVDTQQKPGSDPKVRRALNLAIDRESLAKNVLKGTGVPAYQYIPASDSAFSEDNEKYSYDPEEAKRLLAQAGYPDGVTMDVAYPTSGSGNMIPGPMNEALQSDLAKIGVKVNLKPIDWDRMVEDFVAKKISYGAPAETMTYGFTPPSAWTLTFGSTQPSNIQSYSNPKFDALSKRLYRELDPAKRDEIYQEMNATLVATSPWVVVVSDNNPRATAPAVKGFVQPKAVWVDLTNVTVGD